MYVIILTKAGESMKKQRFFNYVKINRLVLVSGAAIITVLSIVMLVEYNFFKDFSWYNRKIAESLVLTFIIITLLTLLITAFNLRASRNKEKETQKKLQISDTLINCITMLAAERDTHKAIHSLLNILNNYFDGDRAYLFEFDYENQTTSNSYEYTAVGISKQIDNLQNVPLEIIDAWIEKFKTLGSFYISDTEKDVDENTYAYKILKMQDIKSLIAVPLVDDDVIIGFLGIDNPKTNYEDLSLLSSASFFILDSIERRERNVKLQKLSYEDTLTSVYNRNKFNSVVKEMHSKIEDDIGIAYFDINGLKTVNDNEGHHAGDKLIKDAADGINSIFIGDTYRIGGDEFVVISCHVKKEDFEKNVSNAIEKLNGNGISVSFGTSWTHTSENIYEQLSVADHLMYENKMYHYKKMRELKEKNGES